MAELSLKCTCGKVQGIVANVTPDAGTRIICYCDDCQAFTHYLDRADEILDEHGGTDIFQLPPARLRITQGVEQIRCMRLSRKGLYRWYTECCRTPIGNTLSATWPFVGLIHNFIDKANSRDTSIGPIRGYVHTKFAKNSLPNEVRKVGNSPLILLRSLLKLFMWKLKGLGRPSPFFDASGKPVSEPTIRISR